jgi:hypothetical protein
MRKSRPRSQLHQFEFIFAADKLFWYNQCKNLSLESDVKWHPDRFFVRLIDGISGNRLTGIGANKKGFQLE